MPLPTPPRTYPKLIASSDSRKCSNCSSPLSSLGVKALPTLAGNGQAAGALIVETFHCAHCGKVELFEAR